MGNWTVPFSVQTALAMCFEIGGDGWVSNSQVVLAECLIIVEKTFVDISSGQGVEATSSVVGLESYYGDTDSGGGTCNCGDCTSCYLGVWDCES